MQIKFSLIAATLLALFVTTTTATHFRFGLISWRLNSPKTDRRTFRFTIQFVWRRSYMSSNNFGTSNLKVGDTFDIKTYTKKDYWLNFGDSKGGRSTINTQTVTSMSTNEDWLATTWSDTYTYDAVSAQVNYTVWHTESERLSSLGNNNDQPWMIQAQVPLYPASTPFEKINTASPTSGGLPIVTVRTGLINTFQVPFDDDDKSNVTFRMSSLTESLGKNYKRGAILCRFAQISPDGVVTFDARTLSNDMLYQTQHLLDDNQGGIIPIDYLINTVPQVGLCGCDNKRTCLKNADCPKSCNCLFSNPIVIYPGLTTGQTKVMTPTIVQNGNTASAMSWFFVADDTIVNEPVTITASSVPTGATLTSQKACSDNTCSCTDGQCTQPQYVEFKWAKPEVGSYSVCFGVAQTATSPTTQLASGQYCVNIRIATQCGAAGTVNNTAACQTAFNPATCCSCNKPGFDPASLCSSCLPDFFGPNCQSCPNCNNGTCNEGLNGDGTCICPPGYSGVQCQIPQFTVCDSSTSSYIQSQTNSPSSLINPIFANLYMSVDSASKGEAGITYTIKTPQTPSLDIVIIQDVSFNTAADIKSLQDSNQIDYFWNQLYSKYADAMVGLASVGNTADSYTVLGALTNVKTTFSSYAAKAGAAVNQKLQSINAFDAITAVSSGAYGWRPNTYRLVVVMTRNAPVTSGSRWTTASVAMAKQGMNVLFLSQNSTVTQIFKGITDEAGFGFSAALQSQQANWGDSIATSMEYNFLQTTPYVTNDAGFYSGSTSSGLRALGGTGTARVTFKYPSNQVKGQVYSLPKPSVSIMGWGVVDLLLVLNRAPTSANARYNPTQDTSFPFRFTTEDLDNNLLSFRWRTLPNNAQVTISNGTVVARDVFYRDMSQFYLTDKFYSGPSVGVFQLYDGCDTSADYTATFVIQPVDYPPFSKNTRIQVEQKQSIDLNFALPAVIGDPDPSVATSSLTVYIASVPSEGYLTDFNGNILGKGAPVPDQKLYYRAPDSYFWGLTNFTFYCRDSLSSSNVSTVVVDVTFVNHKPTLSGVNTVVVPIGLATSYVINVNDVDNPDNATWFSSYGTLSHVTGVNFRTASGSSGVLAKNGQFTTSSKVSDVTISFTADDYIIGTLGTISVYVQDAYKAKSDTLVTNLVAAPNRAPTLVSWDAVVNAPKGGNGTSTIVANDLDGTHGTSLNFAITRYPVNGTLYTSGGVRITKPLPSGGFNYNSAERVTSAMTSSYGFIYVPNPYTYGSDSLQFTVTDILRATVSGTVQIDVPFVNHAPTVSAPASVQCNIGRNCTINFAVSDPDIPDSESFTFDNYATSEITNVWFVYNGVTRPITPASQLKFLTNATTYATVSLILKLSDTAQGNIGSLSIFATDFTGDKSNIATVQISVGNNNPPTILNALGVTTLEGDSFAPVNITGTDIDGQQGGSLTVTIVNAPAHGSITTKGGQLTRSNFVFSESERSNYAKYANVTSGVSQETSTYGLTYTPNQYYSGLDSFTFFMTDALGGESRVVTMTFNVTFVNHPPVLSTSTESIICGFGADCYFNFTIVDYDPVDSETVNVTAFSLKQTTGFSTFYANTIKRIPGDFPATIFPSLPTRASFSLVVGFNSIIQGNLGQISLRAHDSHGGLSSVVNVTVTAAVSNAPYLASEEVDIKVLEDGSMTFDTTGTDIDGQQGKDLTFIILTPPSNGRISDTFGNVYTAANSILPPGANKPQGKRADLPTSTFTLNYTPTKLFYGRDSYTFIFRDPTGINSVVYTGVFNVTHVNHPPTGSDFVLAGKSGENVTLSNKFIATDLDNDILTLEFITVPEKGVLYNAEGQIITIGSKIVAGSWNSINFWCPVEQFGTPLTNFTFRYHDKDSQSPANYTGSVEITLSRRPPAVSDFNITMNMNTQIGFVFQATNLNPNEEGLLVVNILSDIKGTICFDAASNRCFARAGSNYVNESRILYYTPPVGAYEKNGPFETVQFSAMEPAGQVSTVATAYFTVDYVNLRPVPTFGPVLKSLSADYVEFVLSATDDHTDPALLIYTVVQGPIKGVLHWIPIEQDEEPVLFPGSETPFRLSNENRVMRYYPEGYEWGDDYASFVINVTDADGESTTQNCTVNVAFVNQPPTIVFDTSRYYQTVENVEILVNFNGTDVDTPLWELQGLLTVPPGKGKFYTCIYNEGNCTRGEMILPSTSYLNVTTVVDKHAVWYLLFVPDPNDSSVIYAQPSFQLSDGLKLSDIYSPLIRVVHINEAPQLTYVTPVTTLQGVKLSLNTSVYDQDAGAISIMFTVSVDEGASLDVADQNAFVKVGKRTYCTRFNGTSGINCTASQQFLRNTFSRFTIQSDTAGNYTVQLYVNDLGAGADSDMARTSHREVTGAISVIVTPTDVPVIAATGKSLTWAIGVGSAGGVLGAAGALALVAKLVRKPSDEIFDGMLDFENAAVQDNPLYQEGNVEQDNPLYEAEET